MSLNSLQVESSLKEKVEAIIENTSSLREVTYSYLDLWDGKFLNETIFIEYIWNEIWEWVAWDLEKIKKQAEDKLREDIATLVEYLWECDESEKTEIELLISVLEFTLNWLDFELELAGYNHGLSQEEIQEKTLKQEKLDEQIFGVHASKNLGYVTDTYAYLSYLLENNTEALNEEQRWEIQKWLDVLEKQIEELSWQDFSREDIPPYSPEPKNEDFEKLKEIEISREDYMQIFNYFFEVANVPQRSELWNYSSFYDSDEFYGVPQSSAYATKTLKELLLLWPHETGHYINLAVTESEWTWKKKWDMLKEEWLAKFTEKLISWVPLEKINYMTFSGPSVVLARLMNGKDFLWFQSAFLPLAVAGWETWSVWNIQQKTLRKKRGFSKIYPWGSNKDASYSLWLKQVLDYIRKDGGSVKNLFWGKISMDDVKTESYTPDDFGNRYIYHILLAEVIFFYLQNRGKIKHAGWNFHEQFIVYLKEKYKDLAEEFPLFNEAERFAVQNKMKIGRILKIIDKSIK